MKRSLPHTAERSAVPDPCLPVPLQEKVFGVLVSAVTFHEGRILLLQRSQDQTFMPGAWSLPAGKVLPNEESLEHAVARELREEAGVEGDVGPNFGMSWFESTYYEHRLHHLQFNFVVRAFGSKVDLHDGSNQDHRWLPIEEIDAPPVEIDDFTRSVIKPAIDCFRNRH